MPVFTALSGGHDTAAVLVGRQILLRSQGETFVLDIPLDQRNNKNQRTTEDDTQSDTKRSENGETAAATADPVTVVQDTSKAEFVDVSLFCDYSEDAQAVPTTSTLYIASATSNKELFVWTLRRKASSHSVPKLCVRKRLEKRPRQVLLTRLPEGSTTAATPPVTDDVANLIVLAVDKNGVVWAHEVAETQQRTRWILDHPTSIVTDIATLASFSPTGQKYHFLFFFPCAHRTVLSI